AGAGRRAGPWEPRERAHSRRPRNRGGRRPPGAPGCVPRQRAHRGLPTVVSVTGPRRPGDPPAETEPRLLPDLRGRSRDSPHLSGPVAATGLRLVLPLLP